MILAQEKWQWLVRHGVTVAQLNSMINSRVHSPMEVESPCVIDTR